MCCNTIELYCEKRARQGWTVLQYSAQLSHDMATVAATRHAGAGLGAQEGAGGRWAGRAGRRAAAGGARRWAGAGARRQARGGTRAGGTGLQALGARGRLQARGRARQARGLGAGRAGWLWAVHSTCFWLGIFLSHQMNIVHCKINFFEKKN